MVVLYVDSALFTMHRKKTGGRKKTTSRKNPAGSKKSFSRTQKDNSSRAGPSGEGGDKHRKRIPQGAPSGANAREQMDISDHPRYKQILAKYVYEPAPEFTHGDVETLMAGGNQNYESRMKEFRKELRQAEGISDSEEMSDEPSSDDLSGSRMRVDTATTTPVRPKLPDNDTGEKTPVRPPIPIDLPNPQNTKGKKRSPTPSPPPSPPLDSPLYQDAHSGSTPSASPEISPIPQPQAGVRGMSQPITVVEIPHCRSSKNSRGVQWPLPPNVPLKQMVDVYSTVMHMVNRGMALTTENIKGLGITEAAADTVIHWVFADDYFREEDNNELLELVGKYRNNQTGEIPWEVIGAEMRILTTKPLVNQYQLLESAGLECRGFTPDEDRVILRVVVENPTSANMFSAMVDALEENVRSIRSIRSVMRRLLQLIGSHHHPQSNEMLARNNLKDATKRFLTADKVNLLVELRKENRNGKNWEPLGRLFGLSATQVQRLYQTNNLDKVAAKEWTAAEDKKLAAIVRHLGLHWREVAVVMRKRSPDNCRKRFEKLKKKAGK